jgi:cobalamin biosynthesis protein CbiG
MKAAAAVYALTQQGAFTASRLAARMDVDLFVPSSLAPAKDAHTFDSLRALVPQTFPLYRQHVFIAAVGLAVRCIAPHLKDKSIDPAIVALDHHGKFVVSLLSGHLDGANKLAREVADILGGQAVITTATDTEKLPSFDVLALEFAMGIGNIKAAAKVNAALLAGRPVLVEDPQNLLQLRGSAWKDLFLFSKHEAAKRYSPEETRTMARVTVTPSLAGVDANHLALHPKVLHVGVGCRRGARAEEITELIASSLEQLALAPSSLASLAGEDAKRNEKGLLEAAAELNLPLRFFSAKELDAVSVGISPPKTREAFGAEGVCEPAALLAAGENATLRMPKAARRGIAIAIAEETAATD